jgi:excisionase family DNA binding protein
MSPRVAALFAELASLTARRARLEAEIALALREELAVVHTSGPAVAALPEYLTTREAAAVLGVSERHLKTLRSEGRGPRFVRVGRSVRYPRETLTGTTS